MTDAATPVNPDRDNSRAASSLGQAEKPKASPWQHLVGGIDLTRDHADDLSHFVEGEVDTQDQPIGVKVSRNSGEAGQVVWTKEVNPLLRQLAPLAGWETGNLIHLREWFTRPKHAALAGHVARSHKIAIVDQPRHDAGPFLTTPMILAGDFDTSHRVETLHAGVTLDRLMRCGLCRDATDGSPLAGRRFSHSLAPPLNFLRVTVKLLQALAALDEVGFYHCDIGFRNIAVPADSTPLQDDDGKGYQLKLDWRKAKLIDFGLSCRTGMPPPVELPRWPTDPRISLRFRRFTQDLQSLADAAAANPGQAHTPNLQVYTLIDWREDLYQLGFELTLQVHHHPVMRPVGASAARAFDRLLWGIPHAKTSVPGLLQRLTDWGSAAQCEPLPAGTQRPHEALIADIQAVIAQLDHEHDACNQFHFYQADHDAAYRNELRLARDKHRASVAGQARELATWHAECGSLDDWRKARAQVQARQAAQDQRDADFQAIKSNLAAKVAEHYEAKATLREQTEALTQQAQAQAAHRRLLEADQQRLAGERAALAQAETQAKARQAALYTPRPVPPMRGQPASLDLVELPQGSYLRGSPDSEAERFSAEGPVARVTIAYRLAVARHAVTFDLWDQCMAAGGTQHQPDKRFGGGKQPVIGVSWQDIHRDFLPWLNRLCGLDQAHPSLRFRLLTEAEWEYACRAGGTGAFSLGPRNDSQISTTRANYDGNFSYADNPKGEYREATVPVDSFEPNAWGLYCMHGNVWEWVEDAWADDYSPAPVDGAAQGSPDDAKGARVVRGGSWFNVPWWLRSAIRSWFSPDLRHDFIGFRLARMLP